MTTGYSVTSLLARAEAGAIDAMFQPRVINGPTKYPIVACHGAGGDWFQWMNVDIAAGFPRFHKLLVTAANGGIPSVAPHLGGDTWGNSSGTTLVGSALTAVASASGASNSKVHLVAGSMGAAVALQYAIANPTKVASMTLMIPLASIINLYKTCKPTGFEANNAGCYYSLIATAWGVSKRSVTDVVTNGTTTITSATAAFTSPADVGKLVIARSTVGIPVGTTIQSVTNSTTAVMTNPASTSGSGKIVGFASPLPAGADILANAATLSGIPTRMYYAPDDAVIDVADVTALATAIGGSASATATNGGGHTDAGALPTAFDFDAWVAWLVSNGG